MLFCSTFSTVRKEKVMQLKTVLKQKGYKVKDLYDRVSLR